MAVVEEIVGVEPDRVLLDKGDAVSVATSGLTIIATIKNAGKKFLVFQFDVATANLDDFDVLGRCHPNAQFIDFTPTSWTSLPTGGRMIESSADLAGVAASGNGEFAMDVSGLCEIQVKASATGSAASVTPYSALQ